MKRSQSLLVKGIREMIGQIIMIEKVMVSPITISIIKLKEDNLTLVDIQMGGHNIVQEDHRMGNLKRILTKVTTISRETISKLIQ